MNMAKVIVILGRLCTYLTLTKLEHNIEASSNVFK